MFLQTNIFLIVVEVLAIFFGGHFNSLSAMDGRDPPLKN